MIQIKELRKKHNFTQSKMAELLNTTTSNVSGWECGKWEPDLTTIIEIAKIFKVSTDYVLGLEDEYGNPIFTKEEQAAGLSATKKVSITPIEEDMLEVFRKVGKKHGESAQQAIITVAEKML